MKTLTTDEPDRIKAEWTRARNDFDRAVADLYSAGTTAEWERAVAEWRRAKAEMERADAEWDRAEAAQEKETQ